MQNAQSNHRILVVDDNPAIHDDFQKIFRANNAAEDKLDAMAAGIFGEETKAKCAADFELHFASQGQEALELVRKASAEGRPFAMAFMDVRMPPGWDGIETTSRIWEIAPDLQIAICTAFSDYNFSEITHKLGRPERFVILKKPFETIEVMQLANAFSEKWNLLRQLAEHTQSLEESNATLEQRVRERTQEAEEARLRIEHLLHRSPTVIYSINLPGDGPSFISDNIQNLTGYLPKDFVGNPQFWIEHLHPDDAALTSTSMAKLLESGHHPIEYRFRHRNGHYLWIRDEASVIRDRSGTPVEIIGSWLDITERKQDEEQLHLQTSALEAAANGIVITNAQGKIRWVNPAFTELTGYAADEVLGRTPKFLKSGQHDRAFYEQLWKTILAGKVWRGEIINRRKDGRLFFVDCTITPVFGRNGEIQDFVAIEQDISERKKSEQELQLREASFRALSDNVPDAVARINRDLKFVYVNPTLESLTGIPVSEFVGKTGAEVGLAPHHQFDSAVLRIFETGRSETFEFEDADKSGERYFEARLVPEKTSSGGIESVLSVTRDVTKQKRAEKERQMLELHLRQAQKLEAIGQLAAGIAHEINTPTQYVGDNTRFFRDAFAEMEPVLKNHGVLLSAAKGNALTPELVAEAEKIAAASDLPYLFEQVPTAIKETLEGVERITKIVRAMKEFSHPGGKEKAAADINKAIESTVTVARNEWKYVAELKLDLAPELPAVPCFLGEFNQSILNLIVNAAHAIGDVVKQKPGTMGAITVSTRRDGDHVEIRVSDTGSGIPEAVRPHIFEPFFTTKAVGKGTGQGLNIVYGCIVKKHGGSVRFETEVGKGTIFILRLPLSARTAESELPQTDCTATAGASVGEPERSAGDHGKPETRPSPDLHAVS